MDWFRLRYQATGTAVLDCVWAQRSFTLDIDLDRQRLVLRDVESTEVRAHRSAERLLVHSALFQDPPFTGTWLAVDLAQIDTGSTEVLERALGVDLASYLLAPGLPPSGEDTLRAVLEVAAEIEEVDGPAAGGGQRYRVRVDPDRFAEAQEPTGGPAGDPPIIDVLIEDGRVAQITVLPASPEARTSAGWHLDLAPLPVPLPDAPTTGLTPIESTDWSQLRAATLTGCELDLSPAIGAAGSAHDDDG